MVDTIITKNSSTPGVEPAPSELEVGELAVNLADKKLFSKNASGEVFAFSESGPSAWAGWNDTDYTSITNPGNRTATLQGIFVYRYSATVAVIFYYIFQNNQQQDFVGQVINIDDDTTITQVGDPQVIYSSATLSSTVADWKVEPSPNNPGRFACAASNPSTFPVAQQGLFAIIVDFDGTTFTRYGDPVYSGMAAIAQASPRTNVHWVSDSRILFVGVRNSNDDDYVVLSTDNGASFVLDGPAAVFVSGVGGGNDQAPYSSTLWAYTQGLGGGTESIVVRMIDISGVTAVPASADLVISTAAGRCANLTMKRVGSTDYYLIVWVYTTGFEMRLVRWTGTVFVQSSSFIDTNYITNPAITSMYSVSESTFLWFYPGPGASAVPATSALWSISVDTNTETISVTNRRAYMIPRGASDYFYGQYWPSDGRVALSSNIFGAVLATKFYFP